MKRNHETTVLVPVLFGALLILVTPLRLSGKNPSVHADFKGDGFADLAIGLANEGVGSGEFAGAVNMLYGSAAGLSATDDQFWTRDSPGILDMSDINDAFGDNRFVVGAGSDLSVSRCSSRRHPFPSRRAHGNPPS